MIDFLKKFHKPKIEPLNYIHIHKKNILHNMKVLQSCQPDAELFPVVKANAYGHGLKQIVKILKNHSGKYICVDSFPEYQVVKKYSEKKILVLGETRSKNYKYYDFSRTTFCVYNRETIQYFIGLNKKAKIHLFLNTGMNREGIQKRDLMDVLKLLQGSKVQLEGVCSHLSSADEPEIEVMEKQISLFKDMYEIIIAQNFVPKYRHIGASAATFKMEDIFFNAFRPGMSVYGVNVLEKKDIFYKKAEKLKCAMDIYTTVINSFSVESGESISYNGTYKFDKKSNIVVIPFGYYEGFDRKLSNHYSVKIQGKYYPIRGRICMNLAMVDVGNDAVKIGTQVEILSHISSDKNSIYVMSEKSKTIPYESVVKIQSNIRRKII